MCFCEKQEEDCNQTPLKHTCKRKIERYRRKESEGRGRNGKAKCSTELAHVHIGAVSKERALQQASDALLSWKLR